MAKIILAIPAYNCEKQIIRVLESIKKHINKFNEIIFIENKSSDNTLLEISGFVKKNSLKNVKIYQNENNINLGGSHINIFDYFLNSNNDQLLVMHGDDQADIEDFIKVENEVKNFEWIKFSRFHPRSKLLGYSKLKIVGNKFFNFLFSLILRKKVYDIGSGLDLYNKSFIKQVPFKNFPLNLTFDYYLILFGIYKNKVMFLPQSWKEEDQISNVRLLKQSIELVKIFLEFFYLTIINNQKKFFEKNRNNCDESFFNKFEI